MQMPGRWNEWSDWLDLTKRVQLLIITTLCYCGGQKNISECTTRRTLRLIGQNGRKWCRGSCSVSQEQEAETESGSVGRIRIWHQQHKSIVSTVQAGGGCIVAWGSVGLSRANTNQSCRSNATTYLSIVANLLFQTATSPCHKAKFTFGKSMKLRLKKCSINCVTQSRTTIGIWQIPYHVSWTWVRRKAFHCHCVPHFYCYWMAAVA